MSTATLIRPDLVIIAADEEPPDDRTYRVVLSVSLEIIWEGWVPLVYCPVDGRPVMILGEGPYLTAWCHNWEGTPLCSRPTDLALDLMNAAKLFPDN